MEIQTEEIAREKADFNAQMLNYLMNQHCSDKIEFSEVTNWHTSHPYYRLNNYNGIQISQVLGVYLFFNRDYLSQFDNIIEIGTYNGGLSSYIFDNKKPSARFHSWDIDASLNQVNREDMKYLFQVKDCFEDASFIQSELHMPGRNLLICDGGNKTKEFNYFAPYLSPGTVIILHDYKQDQTSWDEYTTYWQWPYGFETEWEEIEDAVRLYDFEEFDNKRANFYLWGSFIKK